MKSHQSESEAVSDFYIAKLTQYIAAAKKWDSNLGEMLRILKAIIDIVGDRHLVIDRMLYENDYCVLKSAILNGETDELKWLISLVMKKPPKDMQDVLGGPMILAVKCRDDFTLFMFLYSYLSDDQQKKILVKNDYEVFRVAARLNRIDTFRGLCELASRDMIFGMFYAKDFFVLRNSLSHSQIAETALAYVNDYAIAGATGYFGTQNNKDVSDFLALYSNHESDLYKKVAALRELIKNKEKIDPSQSSSVEGKKEYKELKPVVVKVNTSAPHSTPQLPPPPPLNTNQQTSSALVTTSILDESSFRIEPKIDASFLQAAVEPKIVSPPEIG
jgi:hypothetical protein